MIRSAAEVWNGEGSEAQGSGGVRGGGTTQCEESVPKDDEALVTGDRRVREVEGKTRMIRSAVQRQCEVCKAQGLGGVRRLQQDPIALVTERSGVRVRVKARGYWAR